jgi:CheY-like chemotaxis protein
MNKKILVVDDDESVRELLSLILRILGYEVILAENWEQALNLLRSERFDVLFTDFRMPQAMNFEGITNGIELIRFNKLNKLNFKMKIVLMSVDMHDVIESVALAAGADMAIDKSKIRLEAIEELLQNLLEGGD